MAGEKESERDSAVIDLSLTKDGHHGPALEAAMKEVLMDDYGKPPSEHRVPRKVLRFPFGPFYTPPEGLYFQSMPNLKIRGGGIGAFSASKPTGSMIIGRGAMKNPQGAVVTIDGVVEGEMTGISIVGQKEDHSGEMPKYLLVTQKSIPNYEGGTTMHDLDLDIQAGGVWSDTAVRLGNPNYSNAQEDHFRGRIRVIGGYNVLGPDRWDFCRRGVFFGNHQWGNNRRTQMAMVKVQNCRTAVWCEKTGVDIAYLTADGCNEVVSTAGTVGQVVIHGGEAETCARLHVEQHYQGSDFSVTFRDFTARLDGWRPNSIGDENYDPYFGSYGGGGGFLLDRCTISQLPVRRNGSGKLVFVENLNAPQTDWKYTEIPAPKFLLQKPHVYAKTQMLKVWGYRQAARSSEVFEYREGAWARHEGWSDRKTDGMLDGKWERSDFLHTTGMVA